MSDPLAARTGATARRAASAILPDGTKRAIDRVRERRYLRRMRPLNEEFVARYGLEVRHGPFTGMQYLPGQEPISGQLIAKLVGSYEAQLYPWIANEWIGGEFDLMIDVGCAEGYYAVGLAYAMPAATVRAYDTYAPARARCEQLAAINGVAERVLVGGECTPRTLQGHPAERVALLCDCEGYESTLLDPRIAPVLRGWSIIVEQHDNIDPSISATIRERFADSHEISILSPDEGEQDDGADIPELAWMSPDQREFVLAERPHGISWALLSPRHP
jgi:hypothetical protein